MQPERADMSEDLGACPGSRASTEPSSTVSALAGFDPARSLEALLTECQDDYRNTLLDCLDQLWLDGREGGFLTVPQLNAINAATCELAVAWALKGWHRSNRPRAIATEAGTAATVEQGAVHEGAGPQDIAQGPSQ